MVELLLLHCARAGLTGMPAVAQYSPRRRMSGVEVFCSLTGYVSGKRKWRLMTVVLIGNPEINLPMNEEDCRRAGNGSWCEAVITLNQNEGPGP
jgi:hypothetical protein